MHELSVTENILEIATRHANQAEAKKVTDVYLIIGRVSSIVDDSVQFYWDILTENTICAQAKLHFERLEVEMECLDCSNIFTEPSELMPCPRCNSSRLRLIHGDEFRVDSIEIEK